LIRFLADVGVSTSTVQALRDLVYDPRLLEVLAQQEEALIAGAIIIVEDRRYRVRRLPIRP
jgi:hypothetical protein